LKHLIAILSLVLGLNLWGNELLIKEVEQLRNQLPFKDPSRHALTLRLADIYFDAIGEMVKEVSQARTAKATQYRKRAIHLYEQAIDGEKGAYPAAAGSLRTKILFQLARLYSESDAPRTAIQYWIQLVTKPEIIEIQREAALQLAEIYEKSEKAADRHQADRNYELAIKLCGQTDVCSYAHYRRAWLYRQNQEIDRAIHEMELALLDSKGNVREESLRDLILFLGLKPGDGSQALQRIETLSAQWKRPELMAQLGDSFLAAGNKDAAVRVIAHVNALNPELSHQVRLLEEYYGLRRWEDFRQLVGTIKTTPEDLIGLSSSKNQDVESLLKRLLVQLDGERVSHPEHGQDFVSVASVYLHLYPHGRDRMRVLDGWLAVETDPEKRIPLIAGWLQDPTLKLEDADLLRLHESRAAAAEKTKAYPVLIEELGFLEVAYTDPNKKRESSYLKAVSLKELGRTEVALPLFQALANVRTSPDQWAIKSQHLALDLLIKEKNYEGLLAQARSWLGTPAMRESAKDKKEIEKAWVAMSHLVEETEFEMASKLGETKGALTLFSQYCLANKFFPKSCENAKVLAIKLKDQPELFAVLEKLNDLEALKGEYEAAGYFAKAAQIHEAELTKTKALHLNESLKTALLYELDMRLEDRNRVLGLLVTNLKHSKAVPEEMELVVFITLRDAKLLSVSSLDLPWSLKARLRVANYLEESKLGNPRIRKLLLDSKEFAGAAWSDLVMANLEVDFEKQSKISFYGVGGQKKFERRLEALKIATAKAESYFQGSDIKTRLMIAQRLQNAYLGLTEEISKSPIPDGLTKEETDQVIASLAQMAEPFSAKAQAYAEWVTQSKQVMVVEKANSPNPANDPAISISDLKKALAGNPEDRSTIQAFHRLYAAQGKDRLAAYFEGRLKELSTEGQL